MSKMKDFRNIANESMDHIQVSNALKEQTLKRCLKKAHIPMNRWLVPAACLVLAIGVISLPGNLQNKPPMEDQNPEINILVGEEPGSETRPEQDIGLQNGDGLLVTVEEAVDTFGEGFLTPAYIPEEFSLEQILAYGENEQTPTKIVLTYVSKEESFVVIEEKTQTQDRLINATEVDIQGGKGYLNPGMDSESWNNPVSELHWYKNDVHYVIAGQITDKEAIRIAQSMERP